MNSSSGKTEKVNHEDYLGYLDGIRGGAALWVLLAHCAIWGGWKGCRIPDPKIAVDIFMVMSGYLMTYHFLARQEKEPYNSWDTTRKFWIRRFFRIAPLYYTVLIVAFVIGPSVREGYSALREANPHMWVKNIVHDPKWIEYTAENFFMHVTFLFGVIPKYVRGTLIPDWSIGLEMQFYAVFPLLFFIVRRWGYLLTTLFTIGACIGIKRWVSTLPPVYPGADVVFPEPSFLPLKIALFLIGMLAAEAHRSSGRTATCQLMAMMLALALAARQSFFITATTILVILLGSCQNLSEADGPLRWLRGVNKIFANRFARWMADMSYSVYLTHGLFISLIGSYLFRQSWFLQFSPPMRWAILTPIVLIGSYSLAHILFKWIERPGIEWGRRLVKKTSVDKIPAKPALAVIGNDRENNRVN